MADVGQELALEPVGFVQGQVGFGKLPKLQVQPLVDRAELVGALLEIGQHRVERFGKLLEFVAGVDVGADVEVALADFLGGFLQDANGLENQPGGDQIERENGQRSG